MEYEGQICRTPFERGAFMLPIMVGCSYNQCKFCNLFRHLRYRELPLDQIEEELVRVKKCGGNPKRIFLGDGNAFGLKVERLCEILDMIRFYFPDCEMINMDATVTSILCRSDDELLMFAEKGVRHLYIGIESALPDVLHFMKKDHDVQQAKDAVCRIQKAGMLFDAHIMTGVAGHARGMESAEAMAVFMREMRPYSICNFSMFLHREVPLYQNIESGTFRPASEMENLCEEERLIRLLNGCDIFYEGFHDYIAVHVRGHLKNDSDKMLFLLQDAIEKQKKGKPHYAYVTGECDSLEKEDGRCIWDC